MGSIFHECGKGSVSCRLNTTNVNIMININVGIKRTSSHETSHISMSEICEFRVHSINKISVNIPNQRSKNHYSSFLPAGNPELDSQLDGHSKLLLDSSWSNQLDFMSPEEKSSQLEGKSPEEKSSQLEGHSQLPLLDSSRSNQLDLMSPEEKSSQLEGQSPEENSSQLEGHSQLEDS